MSGVSSRTPEGWPGRCPVCEKPVHLEPSEPFGDAPCPHCGSLLRFIHVGGELRLLDEETAERLRGRLRAWIAEQLGVPEAKIGDEWQALKDLGLDSLDLVELFMEIEDEDAG